MEAFCIAAFLIVSFVIYIAAISFHEKQKAELERQRLEAEQRTRAKRERLEHLRTEYQQSLSNLRRDPTNAQYHEQALYAGRAYANATRENQGVTIFDETALANDIRAVTANASQVAPAAVTVSAPASVPASAPAPSLDERIAALQKLRAADMLTEEEFEQKRKDILDSI